MPDTKAARHLTRQTRTEFLQHLDEQRDFLLRSAEAFDDGKRAEAKRLAGVIRLLVHDTGRSRSLLGQLGIKDKVRFYDTRVRPPVPGAIVIHAGLVGIKMSFDGNGDTQFYAPLDHLSPERQGPPVSFEHWWNDEVIRDNEGNAFARKDLVLGLAHLDGGVHVDPELDEAYAALTRANSHGLQLFDIRGALMPEGPVLANVRQIAWEIGASLDQQLPNLLKALR